MVQAVGDIVGSRYDLAHVEQTQMIGNAVRIGPGVVIL